jgi:hypothetical protein
MTAENKKQPDPILRALREVLAEAEVSTVLWHQSRGFIGTVVDAYEKKLMPPAFIRARILLAEIDKQEVL